MTASGGSPNLLDALSAPNVLPKRERAALRAWAFTFYPFQREWLFDGSRFAMCLKSRQIGISHTTGAAAALWGAMLGETTTVISIGQREADEVIEKATLHASALCRLGSRRAEHKPKDGELRFLNGGRVIALPSTSAGRGFAGNIFLDEFGYHVHPEKVWDGASAVSMHGFRLRVASTPNGVGNAFHHMWTNENAHSGYALHTIPLSRALSDGMDVDIDDCWKMAKGDPRLFAQLFECSFLEGDLQYIPTALLELAKVPAWQMPSIEGYAFAGLDIGLENDLTALTVVKLDANGILWEVETRTCKRTSWEEQEAMIRRSFEDWQWHRLSVDQTGIGMVPAERLKRMYGERVEPVTFTMQSKEQLATGLYQAFADKRMLIRDDPNMARDLSSIRRTITTAGNVRYDAPRTSEGHADRAWSLALAVHAASPYVKGRPGAKTEISGLGSNV